MVVAQSQEESPKKDDLIFASAEKATFKEVGPRLSHLFTLCPLISDR